MHLSTSLMIGAITASFILTAMPSARAADPDLGLRMPIPPQAPMTEGLADIGTVKLWYWDTGGTGEAVVFLHPGSGSAELYPYQQPVFVDAGYRVICYSRRGHFRSETGRDVDTFFAADDLLALMDHLGVDRFHLVGNALGGYVALDLALSRPDRVRTLVLASSMMGIAAPEYQTALQALRPKAFSELPPEVQEIGPSYRVANPGGLAEWKARHARAADKRAPVRLRNELTWETIATLKVPTLLMTGDADLWIPPFLLLQIADRFPASEVTIVRDAGHAIQWERPEMFNAHVLDFIDRRAKR